MRPLPRHALSLFLAVLLLVAGCAPRQAPVFERMDFDYLTKLKLDVGRIDIDGGWVPTGSARQVGYLAPTRPEAALRAMAESRLVPGGTQGRAVFKIDNASIIQQGSAYIGDFAVHLDIIGPDEQPRGSVVARVRATQPVTDDEDETAVRSDLDALVRRMMTGLHGMNVELEYQLTKAMGSQLQSTSPDAPAPPAVDTQDLSLPPGAVGRPPPPAPPGVPMPDPSAPPAMLAPPTTLSPPSGTLPPLGPPVVVAPPP